MTKKRHRPSMPPLNALRAFEAAARLGSFSSAADELCVTAAAVAQQIKVLEAWTKLTLFDRHAHGVSLTDSGNLAVPSLTNAFDLLSETVHLLAREANPYKIKIAALPSIAQFWLSPRLSILREKIPELEVSVTTRQAPPNLKREPFDLCLFLEEPNEKEGVIYLMQDEIFPVCAPEVAMRLKTHSDLSSETLLSDHTWIDDWSIWCAEMGCDFHKGEAGPVFSLYGLALEEAKNGAGILIGHSILVEPLLRRQELVAPFNGRLSLRHKLCLRLGMKAEDDPIMSEIVSVLKSVC